MFQNAAHALEWAYNTSAKPIVKMSGINHMRASHMCGIPNDLLIGLTPQHRHQQAAEIIGMIARLSDQAGQEYITAWYGRQLERKDLAITVYRGSAATGLGLLSGGAIYQIVRSYFGRRMTHRQLKKLLGSGVQYAVMTERCLYDMLDIIQHHAMAEMEDILGRHGLIRVSGECVVS